MSLAPQQRPPGSAQPPDGEPERAGFDFTLHMRRLCEEMVARVDALRHVDMSRVAISFSQTRKATRDGMYASLTPLRFAGGQIYTVRRGRRWGMQRLCGSDGREMLYILSFYLPRFLELPYGEKLSTVLHELWHVGPKFDGDVRRFDGRCFAHGSSSKQYEAQVEQLVAQWLAARPAESLDGFLRLSFRELSARYGRVFGRKIPAPKLIPIR
jgi:hypothetical protein